MLHMLEKPEPAMKLLDKYSHPYDVVYSNFIGDILYEDRYQVAVDMSGGEHWQRNAGNVV